MAEDRPSLHIDTDWKKQAQEEKRRLAEQEEKRRQQQQQQTAAPAQSAPAAGPVAGGGVSGAPSAAREGRELPPAEFSTLVQSLMTQVLVYLGDLALRGGEGMVNLDMARHNLDLLTMLEAKTTGNLDEEEKRLLDTALYETRNRFVSVASQYL